MSKLREKLSKWFLGLADKLDHNTYRNETMIIPLSGQPMNVTMYDRNHIEHLRVQQQISNYKLREMQNLNYLEDIIKRKLTEAMSYQITDMFKDSIKKDSVENPYGEATIYSLDVYVCKPQKKKEGDI